MGRKVLLVGIGQIGCLIADAVCERLEKNSVNASSLAFDTDKNLFSKLNSSIAIPMTEPTELCSVVEDLGESLLRGSFPCDRENDHFERIKGLDMDCGSSLWRMKAMLSFNAFMSKKEDTDRLNAILNEMTDSTELYVIASLAGGTGSGLLLPITLYIKKQLKSIGIPVVSSKAFAVMPSVVEGRLSAEQGVKARANAYAALRELNAVNMITLGGSEYRFPPYIDLKLGLTPESTLFDAKSPEYKDPQYAPFDKVYILERIPDMFAVSANTDAFAELVASFCIGGEIRPQNNRNTKANAVFAGASLSKVRYPSGSIVKYIAKKQLSELAGSEMKEILAAVEHGFVALRMTLSGRPLSVRERRMHYCDLFIEKAQELIENEDEHDPLLGRRAFIERYRFVADSDGAAERALAKTVASSLESDAANALFEAVDSLFPTEKELEERKISEKKNFKNVSESIGELLAGYYARGMEIREHDAEFASTLVTQNEGFSVKNDLLKEEGKSLHPIYAMLKLCLFYRSVSSLARAEQRLPEHYSEKEPLPKYLLQLKAIDKPRCLYGSQAGSRLELAVKKKGVVYKKLYKSRALFANDLRFVASRLKESFFASRVDRALDVIGEYLDDLRATLNSIVGFEDELVSDKRLCELENGRDAGIHVNIGASANDKSACFDKYIKEYHDTVEAVEADDAAIGDIVFESALTYGAPSDRKARIESLCSSIEAVYTDRVYKTAFYAEELNKNIVSAMLGQESGALESSRVFAGKSAMLQTGEKRANTAGGLTACILPESARAILTKDVPDRDAGAAERIVEGLMYAVGERSGSVKFVENMSHQEMYIRNETEGSSLDMLAFCDESSYGCEGYTAYVKAMNMAKLQMTPMWDPRVIYNRHFSFTLPYISAEHQNAYMSAVAKAVVYALAYGEVTLDTDEDGELVYFVSENDKKLPVTVNGARVAGSDVNGLMLWAYGERDRTQGYSELFDARLKASRREYPMFDSELSRFEGVAKRMAESDTVKRIFGAFVKLASELLGGNVPSSNVHLECIAEALSESLAGYCFDAPNVYEDIAVAVYNELLSLLRQALDGILGEASQKLVGELNAHGYFLKRALSGEGAD